MNKDIVCFPFCAELHWTINLLLKPQSLAFSLLSSEVTSGNKTRCSSFLQINSSGEVRQGDVKPLQDWLLLSISSHLSVAAASAAATFIKNKSKESSSFLPDNAGVEAEEASDIAVEISRIISSVARGDDDLNLVENADKAVLLIVGQAKYQGQIDTEAVNIAGGAAARIAGIYKDHPAIKLALYVAIGSVFASNAAAASATAASLLKEIAREEIFCKLADFTEKAKNEMEAFKMLEGNLSVLSWTRNASIAASQASEQLGASDCHWEKVTVACMAAHASHKAASAVAVAAAVARKFMQDSQKNCITATLVPNLVPQENYWTCGHAALEALRISLPLLCNAQTDLSNLNDSDLMKIFHKDWFPQSVMDKACPTMAASVHADVAAYMKLSPSNAKPFPSDDEKKKKDLDGLMKAFYAGRPIIPIASWRLVGNCVGLACLCELQVIFLIF